MVLTDGYPNDPGLTHGSTSRILKDGIEIIAVGIQCDFVKTYWENYHVIYDLSDLPKAMFDMMEDALTRRAA